METADSRPIRVGLVGCGNVSRQYLRNTAASEELTVVACADLVGARAESVAREFGVPAALRVDALLADPEIDLVLNLTLPNAHADVTLRAFESGKHVYTEKPLAPDLEDARTIVAVAQRLGLGLGSAPDTVMGAGLTTCARLIAEGAIGQPIGANAFMMSAGPDRFHPAPEFLFRPGAGPLLDIGPYFVTALVALLGPVSSVAGLASTPRGERVIRVGDRAGTPFAVQTPTHVVSLLNFASGVLGTLVTSFDIVGTRTPGFEIHGTAGSLIGPAANSWGGPVLLKRDGDHDFTEVDIGAGATPGFMGMGLIEMARGLRRGSTPTASGIRALHVLDVLNGVLASAHADGAATVITPPHAESMSSSGWRAA
ncbi:Gfo/Idh/MocA family oxidoreductase [Agrococcus sp. ProA11]|uniref:Gfo/Idh/MocA family protein n=1 Tax=Agrococcus chionoecetis TaxID=3153752 RepID=UPI003261905A